MRNFRIDDLKSKINSILNASQDIPACWTIPMDSFNFSEFKEFTFQYNRYTRVVENVMNNGNMSQVSVKVVDIMRVLEDVLYFMIKHGTDGSPRLFGAPADEWFFDFLIKENSNGSHDVILMDIWGNDAARRQPYTLNIRRRNMKALINKLRSIEKYHKYYALNIEVGSEFVYEVIASIENNESITFPAGFGFFDQYSKSASNLTAYSQKM